MKKNLFYECLMALWVLLLGAIPLFSQQNTKLIFPNPAGFQRSNSVALTQTTDGGFVLVGDADASDWPTPGVVILPRLIRLNADLTTAWDSVYFAPGPNEGAYYRPSGRPVEMPNGDFVLAMEDDSSTIQRNIMRVSATGNLVHSVDLPGWCTQTQAFSALPNGDVLVVSREFSPSDAYKVFHITPTGTVAYQKNIPIVTDLWTSVIQLSNGDLLFSQTQPNNAYSNLTRVNTQGDVVWVVNDVQGYVDRGNSWIPLENGTFGYINNGFGLSFWTLHYFNSLGVEEIQSPSINRLGFNFKVDLYPDSSFLLAGQTTTQRGFMQKLKRNGTQEWAIESPDDGQAQIPKFFDGVPTTDGWAAGVGTGNGSVMGFVKVGQNTGVFVNTLTGSVAKDDNNNCSVDAGEVKIGITTVTATSGLETFHSYTNQSGEYTLFLPPGVFTITAETSSLFFEQCPTAPNTVSFPSGANGTAVVNLPMQTSATIHSISGVATLDENDNCTADAGEPVLENWRIVLRQGARFQHLNTDAQGAYTIFVNDGNYTLEFYPRNSNFGVCGSAVRSLSFSGSTPQNEVEDFVVKSLVDCAKMRVSIGNNIVRPCSTRVITVYYRNEGTTNAEDATLTVTLDPALEYITANPAPVTVNGSELLFDLGDVSPSYSGNWLPIDLTVLADCSLNIGNQVCISAAITPDEPCTDSLNWPGAIIAVNGTCVSDSAIFTIQNIGPGDQSNVLDFVIVEDQIVLRQGTFDLNAGQQLVVGALAMDDSTTVSISAVQEPGAPAANPVVFSLTNCQGMSGGNTNGTGGGSGTFSDQTCFLVANSYDPNDKNAYPYGYGEENTVRPGTPLDYTIRFQNTGNDTAFTVILRDTMDANFDMATIEPLGSSHAYTFSQLNDTVLHIRFDNILLPDSTTNPDGSKGYFQFRVAPKADLPLGTEVRNHAAIYFDYNPPIITNSVVRTYNEYFLVSTDEQADIERLRVTVAPNPFVHETTITIPDNTPGLESLVAESLQNQTLQLHLFDASGRLVHTETFGSKSLRLHRKALPSGLLFWKINANGREVSSGKIIAFD